MKSSSRFTMLRVRLPLDINSVFVRFSSSFVRACPAVHTLLSERRISLRDDVSGNAFVFAVPSAPTSRPLRFSEERRIEHIKQTVCSIVGAVVYRRCEVLRDSPFYLRDVNVSRDTRYATVSWSYRHAPQSSIIKRIQRVLLTAVTPVRAECARQLPLKYVPRIVFSYVSERDEYTTTMPNSSAVAKDAFDVMTLATELPNR